MKTLFSILMILSLLLIVSAEAATQSINSRYICGPTVDSHQNEISESNSFEILEELIPVGKLLPAFRNVWSLMIDEPNSTSNSIKSELTYVESVGQYPDLVRVFKDSDYAIEVESSSAKVIGEKGIADCLAVKYRPTGLCTKNMNRNGNPSYCQCLKTHDYNATSGDCEIN